MKQLRQFDPLIIHHFEEQQFHLPSHTHTYYEMVYIFNGSGTHILNANPMPYRAGDLFILAPGDQHHFEIQDSTRFAFIKFTDSYFHSNKHLAPGDLLTGSPESFMRYKLLKEFKMQFDEPYSTILKNSFESIVLHDTLRDVCSSPVVFHIILSVFGVIKEAMADLGTPGWQPPSSKQQLIQYIHQFIYEPRMLQVRRIASHFNIAPSYFSAYFNRNFGISYRGYISNLRVKLIEKRIGSGKVSFKQIADEFGFTDESHLSNFFKSKSGARPGRLKNRSDLQ